MRRRRASHHGLSAIKAAFSEPARINRTLSAANGAEDLGLDEAAVVDVISGLSSRDFDKSMPSDLDPGVWQDVYKPVVNGRELYIKFTLDARGTLLPSSFKANAQ